MMLKRINNYQIFVLLINNFEDSILHKVYLDLGYNLCNYNLLIPLNLLAYGS